MNPTLAGSWSRCCVRRCPVRLGRPARAPRRTASVNSARCRILDSLGSTSGHSVAVAGARRRQALRRVRPLWRRAARTARPARVRMRSRKPWVFALRRLFGWNVRLLTGSSRRVDRVIIPLSGPRSAVWACRTAAEGVGLRTLIARGAGVKLAPPRPWAAKVWHWVWHWVWRWVWHWVWRWGWLWPACTSTLPAVRRSAAQEHRRSPGTARVNGLGCGQPRNACNVRREAVYARGTRW